MNNYCPWRKNMKIKLLLADDNPEYIGEMTAYFSDKEEYEIVGTACNGLEVLEKAPELCPDVILLDLVMPHLDGYGVLERLGGSHKIIVISALSMSNFVSRAINLGASYYMIKPCSMPQLEGRIKECIRSGSSRLRNKSMEEKITNIFITVGIPAHIKGYQFLREAIKMAIDNPDIINSITKRLYPEVATRFSTSPSKVERAIRHAIEVAWNRGKIENINSLFGVRVYSHNEKPTNGEFIALVADKMLLESV